MGQETEQRGSMNHLQKGATHFSFSLKSIRLLIIRWLKQSLKDGVLCLTHVHLFSMVLYHSVYFFLFPFDVV